MKIILETLGGSDLYGTNNAESDHDRMRIYIEKVEKFEGFYEGPKNDPEGGGKLDNKVYRSGGKGPNDAMGPGDTETIASGLKRAVYRMCKGSHQYMEMLWAPATASTREGAELQANSDWFVSQAAVKSTAGAMNNSYSLLRNPDQATGPRVELVKKHGYDTKTLSTIVRLGEQARQLVFLRRMVFPYDAEFVVRHHALKKGVLSFPSALELADEVARNVNTYMRSEEYNKLPEKGNTEAAFNWMTKQYLNYWGVSQAW